MSDLSGSDRHLTDPAAASAMQGDWNAGRGHRLLISGAAIVVLGLILMAIGPEIAPFSPEFTSGPALAAPVAFADIPHTVWLCLGGTPHPPVHWLGTDAGGLDVFSRVIAATRTDMVIALACNLSSVLLGTLIGLFAGFYRGLLSEVLVRASDLLQSFPLLISGMIVVGFSGRSTLNIIAVLSVLYVPAYIRLARLETVAQCHRGYVEAARLLGNSEFGIATRHVLPNIFSPALVQFSVNIGFSILMTAGLSFIGAGVRPPTPEWGSMIALGTDSMLQGEWWPSVYPGIAISVLVFGFAALANGLERLYER